MSSLGGFSRRTIVRAAVPILAISAAATLEACSAEQRIRLRRGIPAPIDA
jgi:hypothetical protein